MRNISPASLEILSRTSNVEPIIVVRVWWSRTTYITYCDKKFADEGLVGKLLQIGGIEDVVDINSAASSVSLSITLDDSDSEIKQIYDHKDIHRVRVQILQWFNEIPLSDAFVIFEGELSSPVEWAEGPRTLRFDVITKLEDLEVGFSAEEGQFEFIPANNVGKAWPIVFGTVAGLKPLQLTEAPSAILASGFAIINNDVWDTELTGLQAAMSKANEQYYAAHQLSILYAIYAGEALLEVNGVNIELHDQYDAASRDYYNQSVQFMEEYIRLNAEYQVKQDDRSNQEQYAYRVLPITQTNLPVGIPITVEIGNYTTTAVVINNSISLGELIEKPDINMQIGTNAYKLGGITDEYQRKNRGQKFNWIDGGTTIKIFNFPRYYIVSLGEVTVLNVWAHNKFGKAVVPRDWYFTTVSFYGSNLKATQLIFPTPITSYPGDWQDGDIEVDCVSAIGSNVVGIMEWVIRRFCSFDFDPVSFNHVAVLVNNYPANFALTERVELVKFLQDVAFQSRCAIWLNDLKFYLRYLPERLSPVETITDTDVEVNSIVLGSTDSERLVTKFTATWKERLNQSEPNKIIYRYNIPKYGVHEEEYNFYIYNNHELVDKSARFWMIRKSNTFKRITCKVMLNKLKIETFDPVLFSFNQKLIADEDVIGIIEKSTFNPDDDTLSIEAWLPVRLGEMILYKFAQPMNVADYYPVLNDEFVKTGNPYSEATGILAPKITFPPYQQLVLKYSKTGRYAPIGDATDTAPGSLVFALDPSSVNQGRPPGVAAFNNETKYQTKDLQTFVFEAMTPATFFGFVREQIGPATYKVDVFTHGFKRATTVITLQLAYIRDGSHLPVGFPLVVYRTVWTGSAADPKNTKIINSEYWAQPAIWVPAPPDETEETP